MAYFADLTDYSFFPELYRPCTKNVGWLSNGEEFPTAAPTESLLDRLWDYCVVSVAQSRGVHWCEFCSAKEVKIERDGRLVGTCQEANLAERHGQRLLIGTSELRVISATGIIYASPTLIYHYVAVHRYNPPSAFITALFDLNMPHPPDVAYFKQLEDLHLEWRNTSRI